MIAMISQCTATGTFVLRVEAMDDDQAGTVNSEVQFAILDDVPFSIGAVSGNITVNGELSAILYNVTVTVSDLGSPNRMGKGHVLIEVANELTVSM